MAVVTIQVLEGLERGHVYSEIPTPVTIGREADNVIRLNDERVSRFHAKIQEDGGRIILTDLDSSNGTRVNGHPVQLRVLQYGDHISIGRCHLIYGSREQIAARAAELSESNFKPKSTSESPTTLSAAAVGQDEEESDSDDFLICSDANQFAEQQLLFPEGPPEVPSKLTPIQRAQLADLIAYVHEQIRRLIDTSHDLPQSPEASRPPDFRLGWEDWQRLLGLEMELARFLKEVADPDH